MRVLLKLLAALLVFGLAVGAGVTWAGAGGVVETVEETALGADVTAAQRARTEAATGLDVTAPGFPAEMVDDEPEEAGYEVTRT